MENNVKSISSEIRKIVSDLNHGGIQGDIEMEALDAVSEKLTVKIFEFSKGEPDFDEIKRALRNMFITGQLHK